VTSAFVLVVEEYDGQRRPGTLFNLLIVLRQLRQLRLLIFLILLRLLSVLGFKLSFNEWSSGWQIGWPNANKQLSMRGACTLKYCMLYPSQYCMLYPSHQYWADWRLCPWVTLPGGQHLSWSSLRFKAQWVVCQHFRPGVGSQSIKRMALLPP
jgi:hypothetical protein